MGTIRTHLVWYHHYPAPAPIVCSMQDPDMDLSELPDRLQEVCGARNAYLESAAMAKELCKKRGGKKKKEAICMYSSILQS